MADPVITVILDRLTRFLEDKVKSEVKLIKGVKKDVQNLAIVLKSLQNVLHDAEKRKLEDQTVKSWIGELQDVLYEVDDVFDELNTNILRKQILGHVEDVEDDLPNLEKVGCSLLHPFSCFKQLSMRRDLALRIKGLNTRLSFIDRERKRYNFVKGNFDVNGFRPVETSSLVDEVEVVGRDSAKSSLISDLLDGSKDEGDPVRVVSLVGTGGIGKTTLAQLVFNDGKVKDHFDCRVWVCVSDPFDEMHIAKSIVESLMNSSPDLSRLDSLLRSIQETMSRKRVLVVLDDVWSEDSSKWERLRPCFKYAAPCSRVLVTTRNEGVAKVMGSIRIHHVSFLSEFDCWSLVCHVALRNKEDQAEYEEIGRLVAKRCKGLPLAAKVMGSLLLLKNSVEEWRSVLDSKIWELEKVEVELFPHLYLSYSHLPVSVRRCLKYCAIFPKDYDIDANELINMWMAQGYLSSSRNGACNEQKGLEYFESLSAHSFIQQIRSDPYKREIKCKMHDIVHDFVQYLMKDECEVVNNRENGKSTIIFCQMPCHHLTWLSAYEDFSRTPVIDMNVEKLRTLFASDAPCESLPQDLFYRLKRVRVLTLHACDLVELPIEIVRLSHLRYLDLSDNPLKNLPETICNLCNLETLNLEDCSFLSKLPNGIGNLVNLRHLIISSTQQLKHIPDGLMKLTELRTLSKFVAGKGHGDLRHLKDLNRLEGSLQIEFYGMGVEDLDDANEAALGKKTKIKYLELNFNCKVSIKALEALQAPPDLQQLRIWRYDGINLPDWLTMSLNNLKVLYIGLCINCETLPPLWKLQSLETLQVEYMWAMKNLGLEFLGIHKVHCVDDDTLKKTRRLFPPLQPLVSFPKLKVLHFNWCTHWEKWEDIPDTEDISATIMPCLHLLRIENCPQLIELPVNLIHMVSTLKQLNIENSAHLIDRYGYDPTEWSGLPHTVSVIPAFRGLPSSRNTIFSRLHRAGEPGGPLDRTRSI
ncbi:antimicrobial response protein [Lithospermum erythrorhizon]|uniref:Antimicrobial response protein n=1 Tax=Lithospermum erythrorhizon TaxID=34254 RepID=A0AAV3QQ12_LITER